MSKVTQFKTSYLDQFIKNKTRKYCLPKEVVIEITQWYTDKMNILNPSDRCYIEAALAVNAVSYHCGRQ